MPTLTRPDGEIYFEVHGSGDPVLLFAPGGLHSRMGYWSGDWPWTDWPRVLAAAGFTAVAMDQRNAGRSWAAVEADHGWHTYAADQLALMDHLGIEKFHILGTCVGGSFCLRMLEEAPARVIAAVLQNPIGVHPDEPDHFQKAHAEWSQELLAARPALSEAALAAFGDNLWGGDFVFSVDRAFVRGCRAPVLLMPGIDIPHPPMIGAELAELLPDVEVLSEWRAPEHLVRQETHGVAFLRKHGSR